MENIFRVRYNSTLDRLEVPKDKMTQRIRRKIESHKLISLAISMFIILSGINFYLIYSFMTILSQR